MKKIISILLVIILTSSLFACKKESTESYTTGVIALKGPTGMGMAELFGNDNYDLKLLSSPDEATADIIAGRFDIAAVPTNLAAVLYNKTNGGIKVVAVNTLGVLYIVENGDTIKSISDLGGKKIGATGMGSTPEYILNYVLEKNGIECEIEYYTEHSELMTKLVSGDVDIAMLPEPNVTTAMSKNSRLRIALSLTEEWNKVSDATLSQGCIIASNSYAENHKSELQTFLADYKKSVDFVNENAKEASVKIAENQIIPSAEIAEKAIPNCNICFIDGDKMKTVLNNLWQVLFDANPKSIGGKMPDEKIWA